MTKKWRAGWLFPLVLAIALGGLSAWLDRISEVTVEETVLNPNEPKYEMEGIAGKRYDAQGALSENLTASKAWQLPNKDEIEFQSPELKIFKEGRQLYQVVSENAHYNTETRKIQYEKDVVMTKAAEADRPAGVLKTNHIVVDTQTRNAQTDAKVDFQYGQSTGSANGLTYNEEQGLLNLPSRVKAIIYDPKQP